ncbi:ion channel [Magnetospirillum sp. SS-4]|uniref:ion channel n=1 Tax=Magnetospirillum sp. SS-4 TaxID=2681465 RepID=UPI00137CD5F7|nr:ion channel [Magnetospirillum sp. SS-4]CAA7622747.1 Cation channel family protein [Magnetospirillum sp. SS-4]
MTARLTDTDRLVRIHGLRGRVQFLYEAHSGFRNGIIAFDLATVLFFLATTFMPMEDWIRWTDYAIGSVLGLDLACRVWVARDRRRLVVSLWTLIDVVVILTMFAPLIAGGYGFLRIMRALRLLRSYALLRQARAAHPWVAANIERLEAATTLLVFIFVVSAFVYVDQVGENKAVANYLDAVYFTVTTLTTTGFGDVTLVGQDGRLLSIIIMVVGVGLFVRFAQAMFRPIKVHVECPACGLTRHDFDAVHCKHCGGIIHIRTEGHGD